MSHHYLLAAAVLALFAGASSAAPPKYAITLVDALPGQTDDCSPNGINDSGQIVGSCLQQAYLWTPGAGIQELSAGAGLKTTAMAINSAGKVTGQVWSASTSQAHIWDAGAGFQLLGGLDSDDPDSQAYAINDADQIVGQSLTPQPSQLLPFVWSPTGGMRTLVEGPNANGGYVNDINNLGVSVGFRGPTQAGQYTTAFRVDAAGVATRLRLPNPKQGATAYALNDLGQVVGSLLALDNRVTRATVWSASGEPLVIDGRTLPQAFSIAYDINNAGQVVGIWRGKGPSSAFYWDSVEGMHDLNQLIDPTDPLAPSVRINESPRINNAGQIAVGALVSGKRRTLLLTPVIAD